MQLLQQRTLLGSIEGAEDNVDLGALLIRLNSVTPAGTLKDKISAALTAYRSSIVSFQHDQILPDVSWWCVCVCLLNRLLHSLSPCVGVRLRHAACWHHKALANASCMCHSVASLDGM